MGFSELVRKSGDNHEPVYSLMLGLHDAIGLAHGLVAEGDERTQTVSRPTGLSSQLRGVQFSDAIAIITTDASASSSVLIQLASQLLFMHALKHGAVLRGAIARGTVTADFDRSIFFGQPIIDAYRLEEAQQWYGVAVHPTADGVDVSDVLQLTSAQIPLTETVEVPLKNEKAPAELSAINWPVLAESLDDLETMLSPFDGSDSSDPRRLGEYHDRTLEFAKAMWTSHRSRGNDST